MNEVSNTCSLYQALKNVVHSLRLSLTGIFILVLLIGPAGLYAMRINTPLINPYIILLPDSVVAEGDIPDVHNRLIRIIAEIETEWKSDHKGHVEALAGEGFSMVSKQEVHDSVYAALLHVYGKILIDRHAYQQGIDTLMKSVTRKKMVFPGSHYSLAKTYNYMGIGYFRMNDFKHASKFYKLSADILKKNNMWGPGLYDSYLNMGIVEAVQGKYDRAFYYFDTTRVVLDSIGTDVDSLMLARFYNNYGLFATLNGRLQEGNNYFNIAESIYLKTLGSNHTSIANINLNKGINAYYNYDIEKSILYYKRALDIYLANSRFGDRVPITYLNLSAVSLKAGKNTLTVQYAQDGLRFDPIDEIKWKLYSNMAQAYLVMEEEKNALRFFRKAAALSESEKISAVAKINLFMALGDFMLKKNNWSESKKFYNKAMQIIVSSYGQHSASYARVLSKLGYYYMETSSIDSSLISFNASIRVLTEEPDSTGVDLETFNEVVFTESYIGRSKALYRKYQETNSMHFLKQAYADIRMILEKMEVVSSKLDRESKLLLNEQMNPGYDLAITMAYQLYEVTKDNMYVRDAFTCSEKSKSAVLLSSIRNLNALESTDVPPGLMEQEKNLNEEINGIRQMLVEEQQKRSPEAVKVSFFETRLLQLIIDQDSLTDKLEIKYPRYYSLKYDRSTIPLADVMKKLKEDEAIIEYALTDSTIYIHGITGEGAMLRKVILDSAFWNSMDYMLNLKNVDISTLSTKEFKNFYDHSERLWAVLIKPVYNFVLSKRLIIIPDGVLGYFPFEILTKSSENPEELDFKTMPYLLKEFPVSYSYSATLKYNPYFMKDLKSNDKLLAFAPEYVSAAEDDTYSRGAPLANLPNAEREAKRIKDIWGGEVLTKEQATKSNFLKRAEKFKVLHLAMHTLINDTTPMYSKLVFTRSASDTASYMLNTYEVYDLNLNAAMVTLSACNTGTGRLRTGEGIMSLARGFIYAGVSSIVMTLWEVQDKSGSDLMIEFYKNLLDGDPKDIALQKAKLNMLGTSTTAKTHPFYWSAYIVTGDTQPLMNKVGEARYVLPVFVLMILFVIVFLREKKKRKY